MLRSPAASRGSVRAVDTGGITLQQARGRENTELQRAGGKRLPPRPSSRAARSSPVSCWASELDGRVFSRHAAAVCRNVLAGRILDVEAPGHVRRAMSWPSPIARSSRA